MFSLSTAPATYSHAYASESMAGTYFVRCAEHCGTVMAGIRGEGAAMDVLAHHNRTAHGNACGCSWPCAEGDH